MITHAGADSIIDLSSFDKIVMLDFVEYVDDELLERIVANFRAGWEGSFLFTPDGFHPYERAQRLKLASGDPTHINVKPWWKWVGFFGNNGVEVVRLMPATSHPAWLARIERPFLNVALLRRVMIRSVGSELRCRPNQSDAST